jgi:hypothetical protein
VRLDAEMQCLRCGRSLRAFYFELVELHPHVSVDDV